MRGGTGSALGQAVVAEVLDAGGAGSCGYDGGSRGVRIVSFTGDENRNAADMASPGAGRGRRAHSLGIGLRVLLLRDHRQVELAE